MSSTLSMVFVVFAARSKLLKMQAGWYQWTRRAGAVLSFRACVGHRVDGVERGAIDATWTWRAMPTRTTRRE
jgi:hypothetical protein